MMFVTRIGFLFFVFKRWLMTVLGEAGQRGVETYLEMSRRLTDREGARVAARGVGQADYYELFSLYPELQRVLFIHIPKCGGTSVRRMLVREGRCAPIPTPEGGAIGQATNYMVFSAARRTVQRRFLNHCVNEEEASSPRQRYLKVFTGYYVTQRPKRIFILGHMNARQLLPHFRRHRDQFFATVRAPADILKSLVAYRVTQTLADNHHPDSVALLGTLGVDIQQFSELVHSQPRHLAERILEKQSPLLTTSLAFGEDVGYEAVWAGIRERNVFLAHLSEQSLMVGRLLGCEPGEYRENASVDRTGLAAEFSAAVRKDWAEPFVDADSRMLYERLESVGIIGFWRNGGTVREYTDLLRNA